MRVYFLFPFLFFFDFCLLRMAEEERAEVGGEPTYEFVDEEWDEDIVCSVCSFPLEAPTTHKTCNESFCLECVQESFECPSCNKDPGEDSFSPVTQRFVLRMLGKVKVKCILCSIVCPISEFEIHKKECTAVRVECGGKHLGCGYSGQQTDLPFHEKDCPLFKLSPLLTNLTNRIESLETKSETLELANNALRETSSKQTNQIAALEKKSQELQLANNTLRETSSKQTNQITALKKKNTNLEKEIKALRTSSSDLINRTKDQLLCLERKSKKLEKIDGLQGKNEFLEKEIAALRTSSSDWTNFCNTLHDRITSLEMKAKKIDGLEGKNAILEKDIAALRTSSFGWINTFLDQITSLEKKAKKIGGLEGKNAILEKDIAALQTSSSDFINKTKDRITSLERKAKKIEKIDFLDTISANLANELEVQTSNIKDLQRNPFSGVSYVEIPILSMKSLFSKSVELFSGFYRFRVSFEKNGQHLAVFLYFVRGPFDDFFPEFPFEGKVIFTLLSSIQSLSRNISSSIVTTNPREQEFGHSFPSKHGRGWGEFLKWEKIRLLLDLGRKLWFSVQVERKTPQSYLSF